MRISRTKRFSGIERGEDLSELTMTNRNVGYIKDRNSAGTDEKVTNYAN